MWLNKLVRMTGGACLWSSTSFINGVKVPHSSGITPSSDEPPRPEKLGDQVVPNPLQGAVGQAPEGWADASPTGAPAAAAARPVATTKVADDGFPRWFHQYQAWLKPRDGKFAPLLLLLSWHGCACGCCGCCGCICGHSLGETPPLVEGVPSGGSASEA